MLILIVKARAVEQVVRIALHRYRCHFRQQRVSVLLHSVRSGCADVSECLPDERIPLMDWLLRLDVLLNGENGERKRLSKPVLNTE